MKQVVYKRHTLPAQNKWTKMDPAFSQTILQAHFFELTKDALERKLGITYMDLTASGQADPGDDPDGCGQAQENQESYKGAMKRFGKRCLAFLGDPDAKMFLLVWSVLGQ